MESALTLAPEQHFDSGPITGIPERSTAPRPSTGQHWSPSMVLAKKPKKAVRVPIYREIDSNNSEKWQFPENSSGLINMICHAPCRLLHAHLISTR
ncbi:hypothetical protein KIL84_011967 [Mauremys mutica]|uniref:Uncharacterized protein n=1 Tax=Mauremys mutica TaxID=74926 RepID=A0A9D3XFS6_9SAUR|nr:hypothetical protein KIL84_011967 [Mauremys mutica]